MVLIQHRICHERGQVPVTDNLLRDFDVAQPEQRLLGQHQFGHRLA